MAKIIVEEIKENDRELIARMFAVLVPAARNVIFCTGDGVCSAPVNPPAYAKHHKRRGRKKIRRIVSPPTVTHVSASDRLKEDVQGGVQHEESQESKPKETHKKRSDHAGGRWSLKFDKCQKCGTIERKHAAKGLCINCYMAKHNNPDAQQRQDEIAEERKIMGHAVCQNPACPFDPSDYRNQDMINVNGSAYCSEECAADAQK